ncbi:hypothetical protein [Auritidibacter ignavus]|uniref:hypothetical protein n=1 Tax=Auritidibacter ignavus TaxID=678932 RepID=UPI002449D063|nr:hypothetical protein [Auritidibacter ignavus]WGH83006.1 hypothetical protein QDX20_06860 [Auritidibacter ignavus]
MSYAVIVIYVPTENAEAVRDALAEVVGPIGEYYGASFTSQGTGRFTPLPGAAPAIGEVARAEEVAEDRIEMMAPIDKARAAVQAALAVHPYEQPAYHIIPVSTLEDFRE